jgi:thiol-disulfide isomerase/thioredoxin
VEELAELGVEIPETGKVILDISAEWCQPCKQLTPVLEKLAEEGEITLAKADLDEHHDFFDAHNVNAVPTMVFFKDGQRIGDILLGGENDVPLPLADVLADVFECNYKYQILQDGQPVDDLGPFSVRLTRSPVQNGVMVGFRSEEELREIVARM